MTIEAEASFAAKLSGKLGELADAINRDRDERRRAAFMAEAQRFIRIHGKTTLDANGFGVIAFDNGGPDMGWYWYVRKLAILGATPSTTVNGRGDVYVSSSDYRRFVSLAQCAAQDWQDQATTLPLVGPYTDGELELRMTEKLYVVISGGTASQDVHCVGTIKQLQESVMRQETAG